MEAITKPILGIILQTIQENTQTKAQSQKVMQCK